jgi:hypothetical protein
VSEIHRGHAVDFFDGRCFRIIHHLAMVATGIDGGYGDAV